MLCCTTLQAKELIVKVNSNLKVPLANIVVYVEPENKALLSQESLPIKSDATVDQVNRQFVPHILVVNKSTKVDFPNSDKIKHHVYSFSPAKSFEIKLYGDKKSQPILFNQEGEVTLGCNIHDWMLGYVYVVDTPWFGKTDEQGEINFDLPEGRYQLKIWHPLLEQIDKSYSKSIVISGDITHIVSLKEEMSPAYSAYEEDDELDDY